MTQVYINGSPLKLDAKRIIGQGGEAIIYEIGAEKVLKLFKQPDHPDFASRPDIQQAVHNRLDEYQVKLPAFPKNFPPEVISPLECATDSRGKKMLGYVMRKVSNATELIRYNDKSFRRSIPQHAIREIMLDLHTTVSKLHAQHAVIGDFNDLNVLVKDAKSYIIDTDSFQFGPFLCRMFTERFVDPTLCSLSDSIMLARPYQETSDWYAYAAILMQLLLFVGPYGGIHKPQNGTHKYRHRERLLNRITVFHPDVAYPKPALHYSLLPDELLNEFSKIFEHDKREVFPRQLVDSIHWKQCSSCTILHARTECPACYVIKPHIVKEQISIRGTVTANRIFRTHGTIVHAASKNGTLQWLYIENGVLKREQGTIICHCGMRTHNQYGIIGTDSIVAYRGRIEKYSRSNEVTTLSADYTDGFTQCATDGETLYWLEQGRLLKQTAYGSISIGSTLAGHTRFWMGPTFGFGFYRAGALSNAFIAKTNGSVLNDTVPIPQIRGRILKAHCTFSKELCWFAITTDEYGKLIHRAYLINAKGCVLAHEESNAADTSWISTLEGSCAIGSFLFVPTDKGIIRVEQSGISLIVTREFPDTESFVDADCTLLPCQGGIAVISANEITQLSL